MALNGNDPISKTDFINRFGQVVRDYVVANTDWTSSTGVWNTTVGNVTGGQAQSTTDPGLPSDATIEDMVRANENTTASILGVFRDSMALYSRNHRIRLYNTGNRGAKNYYGVVRLNTTHGLDVTVDSDYVSNLSANAIIPDVLVDASDLENFFSACQSSWDARCHSISYAAQYNYNYCHSNFSQFGSHGSRGRR